MSILPWVHILATLYMVGLVWFVQLVQYPLFASVDPGSFPDYHSSYLEKTRWAIAPMMLIELGTGLWLALQLRSDFSWALAISLVLIVVVWLVTFFVSVPQHAILERGFDEKAWRTLLDTNWIRTIAWSARAVLLLLWMSGSR
ncbi:MAG: hypothetical protein HKN21_05150 [Candidatus Eisenbacteria bacterium]|uniref:DUF1772 domain-containing protein n=1 Tax=Eiseniibacteriota bacterium TaxID=2212470 RepID=A0A7Y2H1X8_UNCEI|nr:hypothetical protein [Candidatus Eisenbacteria bacterium]